MPYARSRLKAVPGLSHHRELPARERQSEIGEAAAALPPRLRRPGVIHRRGKKLLPQRRLVANLFASGCKEGSFLLRSSPGGDGRAGGVGARRSAAAETGTGTHLRTCTEVLAYRPRVRTPRERPCGGR